MELKVWVEGIQRIVCGVTETTTCQDVVFALAHATGKSGRFTLIERWRNNERQLAPNENPLKILTKWGEYSNDVQFILQWNDLKNQSTASGKTNKTVTPTTSPTSSPLSQNITDLPERHRDIQKSLTFSGGHNAGPENVGIVKGVPHVVRNPLLEVKEGVATSPPSSGCNSPKKSGAASDSATSQRIAPPYKDPPAPPPYRDPPPPANHHEKYKKNILQEAARQQQQQQCANNNKEATDDSHRNKLHKYEETVFYNSQYRELVSLINFQREKLSSQQADLTKFDAEIVFLEGKEREKQVQLDFIAQEIATVSNVGRIHQDQIQALNYIEEESEIVKQQEKTLKSEITLLRSKLANCETELLQCKNKIRLVMDELQMEQRVQFRRNESKKQYELHLLAEVERLQHDIELAKQSTELHHMTAETLKKEVALLEDAIIEKKKQVEHLVTEMKEANLQSLSIAPPDEQLKHLLEGQGKGGSTRRMIGSPRQLENAVPTNKNPHGVWV